MAQNFKCSGYKNLFMKRNQLPLAACFLAVALWSCNSGTNSSGSSTDTTTTSSNTTNATTPGTGDSSANTSSSANTTTAPAAKLGKSDSTFVMKAAIGGMEEVALGNVATQNASDPRVKNFGQMMVTDHSKANDELKSYASSRGITLPSDLPADKQKHVDAMKKMTGKSFDEHYIGMMVSDHKEDISEFEKASKDANDADLKNWATKTLPTLKTHLDSAQSINKHK